MFYCEPVTHRYLLIQVHEELEETKSQELLLPPLRQAVHWQQVVCVRQGEAGGGGAGRPREHGGEGRRQQTRLQRLPGLVQARLQPHPPAVQVQLTAQQLRHVQVQQHSQPQQTQEFHQAAKVTFHSSQGWLLVNFLTFSRTMSAEIVNNEDFMTSQESITLLPGAGNFPMSPKKTRQSWQHILNTPLKLN